MTKTETVAASASTQPSTLLRARTYVHHDATKFIQPGAGPTWNETCGVIFLHNERPILRGGAQAGAIHHGGVDPAIARKPRQPRRRNRSSERRDPVRQTRTLRQAAGHAGQADQFD